MKLLISSICLVFTLLFSPLISAQDFSKLDKSPMDVAAFPIDYKDSNKHIKITYSHPQLKGRTLSKLAPLGKVWRTGANEAAELTLYKTMTLGDTTIKAGTYTFYVIPEQTTWTAIINTDTNVWGSYFYDKNKDVARLEVPLKSSKEHLEAFSIAFTKASTGIDMHLGWDNARITVPFTN
jgi:hypothetical protein